MNRSKRRSSADSALSLSFLDVLTCGMGACILLFLSLSAVRNDSGRTPYVDEFIQGQWQLNSRDAVIAFRIVVKPDQGRDQVHMLGSERGGLKDGRLTPAGTLAESVYVFGSSSRTSFRNVEGAEGSDASVLLLHLHKPIPGCWSIEPVLVDYLDIYDRVLAGGEAPTVEFSNGWLATRKGVQQRLRSSSAAGLGQGVKWDESGASKCIQVRPSGDRRGS